MFSSPPLPKDLNLPFPSSPFKEEADPLHHQLRSGLVRYHSAPGSLLADLNEAETMFARFMAPPPDMRAKQTAPNVCQPPQSIFQLHHLQQQVPNPSLGSMGVDQAQRNVKHGVSSSLIRQSSSPSGLVNHLGFDIGLRDGGGGRIKGQMSFPSRQSSLLSRISEDGDDGTEGGAADEGIAGWSSLPSFPVTSWEGGGARPEGFSGGKRSREPSEAQKGDVGNQIPSLAHHLSFLKRMADTENMERLLQFQDVVPCKARAKRGCATHPRSIAERVRRTRISERMRKLQELVPNMDKQTNTADMLDLAVEYIKNLQQQAKVLSDSRERCICSNKMHA